MHHNTPRALTYEQAVAEGLEPDAYQSKSFPSGAWVGCLDFKTWDDRGLNCFFTDHNSARRYRLLACKHHSGTSLRYGAIDGEIDFSLPFPALCQQLFLLTVELCDGNPIWVKVRPTVSFERHRMRQKFRENFKKKQNINLL